MSEGPLKILYVDDEPDIRLIGEMSLKLDPLIDVRTAGSGREALALLDAGEWQPDLLLLDVTMPEMDGPGLLSVVRDRPGRGPRAIFMTARAQTREVTSYLALGALDVIVKPFDPMQLASQIRAILRTDR